MKVVRVRVRKGLGFRVYIIYTKEINLKLRTSGLGFGSL